MQVGQQVYLRHLNTRTSGLIETTVTKVGNKYFEVESVRGRFFRETMKHDGRGYSSSYMVYVTKKQYEEECEFSHLVDKIKSTYFSGLSLEQLRQINKIIQDGKDN
jgi:hypothetical protein